MDLSPGRIIGGRFVVIRKIGGGGFGSVYVADDQTIARQVAIKLVTTDALPGLVLREAQALGRLTHPNIVTIYDVGQLEDETPFLAMQYIDGQTLDELYPPNRLSTIERLKVLEQLCDGLAAAHAAGIIHRDIKPSNLLVDRSHTLRIVDFGIARAIGGTTLLAQGLIAGSPGYMAPEQLTGSEVDHRADVFATSVVAYELLSGRRAFPGEPQSALRRLQSTTLPPLPAMVGGVNKSLDVVLKRGLARDLSLRFASIDALHDALRSIRRHAEATETGVTAPLALPTLPPELDPSGVPPSMFRGGESSLGTDATRTRARRRLMPVLVVVAGLTAAAIGIVLRPKAVGEDAIKTPSGIPSPPLEAVGPTQTQPNPSKKSRAPSKPEDNEAPSSSAVPVPADAESVSGPASSSSIAVPDPPLLAVESALTVPGKAVRDDGKAEIDQVIEAFVQAHRNKSTAALKALQPSLTGGELGALDRSFAENADYDYRISEIVIATNDTRARVNCTVTRIFGSSGNRRTITRPAVFDLERSGESWIVMGYRVAP